MNRVICDVDREILRHTSKNSYKQRLDWLEQAIKFFRKTLSPKAKRALLKKISQNSEAYKYLL